MALDVEAARAAVQTIADAMGLTLEEAADGILRIVNENMAGALRVICVQRGHDPREFALVAFGGAGPLHANAVAELMGSFPVIVPPSPGLLCALGDLVAGFRNEFAQTLIRLTAEVDRRGAARDPRRARGARARVDGRAGHRRRGAARRVRRRHALPRPGLRDPGAAGTTDLEERFNALHEQLYGFRMPNTASEIVNLRAVGTGDRPQPELPEEEPREAALRAPARTTAPTCTPARIIPGPSIVTEFDSTTVVLDGYVAEVDRHFNLLIRRRP